MAAHAVGSGRLLPLRMRCGWFCGAVCVPPFGHQLQLGHTGSTHGTSASGQQCCVSHAVCCRMLKTAPALSWPAIVSPNPYVLLGSCCSRLLEALRPAVRARADHGQDQAAPGGLETL